MAMIETVTVVRPLKIIALICLIVATILLIISLATTTWLKSGGFRTGLFEECTSKDALIPLPPAAPATGSCSRVNSRGKGGCGKAYIKVTAALLIIAGLLTLVAIGFTVFGLLTSSTNRKYLGYRIAMYSALVAVLLELVSLILFPVCFYMEIKDWNMPSWDFDWSYGVAWGATFFTFGAALLLLCDKEDQEIYYKEKTIYTPAAKEAPA